MHEAFDAHLGSHGRVGPGWALVPEAELVEDIYTKIVSERDRRQQDGIKGPWPDFRSESVSTNFAGWSLGAHRHDAAIHFHSGSQPGKAATNIFLFH